jgi:hypothetical protein
MMKIANIAPKCRFWLTGDAEYVNGAQNDAVEVDERCLYAGTNGHRQGRIFVRFERIFP